MLYTFLRAGAPVRESARLLIEVMLPRAGDAVGVEGLGVAAAVVGATGVAAAVGFARWRLRSPMLAVRERSMESLRSLREGGDGGWEGRS
jgi:hypothetical protein